MTSLSLKNTSSVTRAIYLIALIVIGAIGCNIISRDGSGAANKSSSTGQHTSWKQYGGSADQSRYLEFKQIDKTNVSELQVVWTYPTSDKYTS